MVESMYGSTVFYEDAVNEIFPEIYEKAVTEQEPEGCRQPSVTDMDCHGRTATVVLTVYHRAVSRGHARASTRGIEVPKDGQCPIGKADVDSRSSSRMAERNSRIETVEREAKNGDTVVIDFEGFVDGKAV